MKKPMIGPLNSVNIGRDRIERVNYTCLLGVTIDVRLSWLQHLIDIKKSFTNKLNLIKRSSFLGRETLLDLYYKVILPAVLYGLIVWGGCRTAKLLGNTSPQSSSCILPTGNLNPMITIFLVFFLILVLRCNSF